MRLGEVVDERFEIERHAGSGGMGHVFQARDLRTGERIALKLLHVAGETELSRFAREAQALSTIRVPGVVRYIAHGATKNGEPYLAMEWLDGETLADRLDRGPLTVPECLELGTRVAVTLGAVHRLGVLHRDLKPSNLLLPGGDLGRATLIDFGVARMLTVADAVPTMLTVPGVLLGTPGYMAPEQARGQERIDARVDVFALGCVLYKCVSGRAPFQGLGGLAVLAKVLLEEPMRLREIDAEVPSTLDRLVARMLAKAPEQRPRDGDAVAIELAAVERQLVAAAGGPTSRGARPVEITGDERQVMCVALARDRPADVDETLSEQAEVQRQKELAAVAERYEGRIELIKARTPLVVLSGAGTPTDLAARAARCALALQRLLGGRPVSLVTGRAELAARLPVGELIDRAVDLLPADSEASGAVAVRIDDVTAALLGTRFHTTHDEAGRWLYGTREELDVTPQLLGKAVPCVGRDRELALLAAEWDHCVEEPAATSVVVAGASGMGKSRLRHEFLRALRERGAAGEIWIGKSDPMSAGSAFGLLAHALRRAVGIVDGEPLAARRRKVRQRVERHAQLDVARVTRFLGELVGAPFPDGDDVQLRAARRSAILMGDQLRLAWEEFLEAECAAQPVLLVLEDLHWGDLPTVTMVEAALKNLKDRPFMVLGLGRPELYDLFPKLWQDAQGHHIRLTPLPRRASERLVRLVLGARVDDELAAKLVQRADGNPFYLEEQIRAAAKSTSEAMPETLLAMVQADLQALGSEARRALRAASVFGATFSAEGVAALVGGVDIAPQLALLERREVIRRSFGDGGPDEGEYRFRHELVREAAYGMLTERDRQIGHALAGDWLARSGDADPMALAEHFERGGEPARAASAYLSAAQQALRGNDLRAAIDRAERGIACGAEPTIAGALRLVQADAHRWRGEYALAEQRGVEAIERLPAGSADWFSAIAQVVTAASRSGGFERVPRWMSAARDAVALSAAQVAQQVCLGSIAGELALGGQYAAADALIEAVDRAAAEPSGRDLEVVARLARARSIRALASEDPGAALQHQRAALDAFEAAGDRRSACMARTNVAFLLVQLGDFEAAESALRAALAAAERMQLPAVVANVLQNFGPVLAQRGQIVEARAAEEASLVEFQRLGNPRMEGCSRSYLATILLLAGEPEAALREARAAAELLKTSPPLRAWSVAVLSRALLQGGRVGEAAEAAREASALLESLGAEEGESLIRLAHAEAAIACGARDEIEAAVASARGALLARAAKISDPAWRARFLRNVPDNAMTLELAARFLGEGGVST